MLKHTPGPLGVSSSALVVTKDGRITANCIPLDVPGLSVPFFEAEANATLYAAAPELLTACEDALQVIHNVLEDLPTGAPHAIRLCNCKDGLQGAMEKAGAL